MNAIAPPRIRRRPATVPSMLDPGLETMPRERLAQLQLERLRRTLRDAWAGVDWHRERLAAAGFEPSALRSLDDLRRLPLMGKSDLRERYPFGLLARPRSELRRLHASSGTTGQATVVAYTASDLRHWAQLMARSMACAGVRRGDVVHNAYGYGLFTGGLGMHDAAQRLGATVVPASGGNTERQVMLLRDFGARVLCATPSYALAIAENAEKMRIPLRRGPLAIGLFGAEPWSEAMRCELEGRLGLQAFDVYGLSEVMGPGVAIECARRAGLHGWEDHFLFETVDPDTGAPVADGAAGELVITTLTRQAMPMIRYRTRDITRLHRRGCDCGRTHLRIARLTGRSDDMLIVRGVNVYPSQIEAALLALPAVTPNYRIVVERRGALDAMTIEIEAADAAIAGDAGAAARLGAELRERVKSATGLSAEIALKRPGELPRSAGKAERVRDLRRIPEGGVR
ncbi:MAG TPA: phenylacetate--CoA ligase [Burkholderiaceae bacterium]|nr:phenylacetate--CoA ligase [Burkholderiaceae bacterium]